jgi:hypothetical protein
MTALEFVSEQTGISIDRLEYTDGPSTGVGTEFYILDKPTQNAFYVVNDQEDWIISNFCDLP